MKVPEIERNFLGPKTGSSRVLRGTKCPKKVPRRAPYGLKIGGNLVNCPLLQDCAYPGWRPKIWSGPENQPGACPRKRRETTIFGKTSRPTSPGPKYWPESCPTGRSRRAHPGYMKVTEIERNFLGPKTGWSRVLRGTKCPKKVPRCAL